MNILQLPESEQIALYEKAADQSAKRQAEVMDKAKRRSDLSIVLKVWIQQLGLVIFLAILANMLALDPAVMIASAALFLALYVRATR